MVRSAQAARSAKTLWSAKALAERVQSLLRSEPDGRRAVAPQGAKAGRKVRTPQGSAPANARSGQPEGQWHRKYTASDGSPKGPSYVLRRQP